MANFEHAILFKSIVEEGSLTKAAIKLDTNVSAVSKRLHSLEQALGTQLLKRTTRKMVLTEAGHFFYAQMKHLHHHWQSTIDDTSSYQQDIKGKLVVAAPQPVITRFLLPFIAQFKQRYPAVELEILHRQIHQLPSLDADISISRELEHFDSHTTAVRPFYEYHNQLFATPAYLQAHETISNLHDLTKHTCLSYENVDDWHFSNDSIHLSNTLKTNNAEIMIQSAKNSLGIAYLPAILLQQEIAAKELVAVLPQYRSRQWRTCAYFQKTDFMPLKLRNFIDLLCG